MLAVSSLLPAFTPDNFWEKFIKSLQEFKQPPVAVTSPKLIKANQKFIYYIERFQPKLVNLLASVPAEYKPQTNISLAGQIRNILLNSQKIIDGDNTDLFLVASKLAEYGIIASEVDLTGQTAVITKFNELIECLTKLSKYKRLLSAEFNKYTPVLQQLLISHKVVFSPEMFVKIITADFSEKVDQAAHIVSGVRTIISVAIEPNLFDAFMKWMTAPQPRSSAAGGAASSRPLVPDSTISFGPPLGLSGSVTRSMPSMELQYADTKYYAAVLFAVEAGCDLVKALTLFRFTPEEVAAFTENIGVLSKEEVDEKLPKLLSSIIVALRKDHGSIETDSTLVFFDDDKDDPFISLTDDYYDKFKKNIFLSLMRLYVLRKNSISEQFPENFEEMESAVTAIDTPETFELKILNGYVFWLEKCLSINAEALASKLGSNPLSNPAQYVEKLKDIIKRFYDPANTDKSSIVDELLAAHKKLIDALSTRTITLTSALKSIFSRVDKTDGAFENIQFLVASKKLSTFKQRLKNTVIAHSYKQLLSRSYQEQIKAKLENAIDDAVTEGLSRNCIEKLRTLYFLLNNNKFHEISQVLLELKRITGKPDSFPTYLLDSFDKKVEYFKKHLSEKIESTPTLIPEDVKTPKEELRKNIKMVFENASYAQSLESTIGKLIDDRNKNISDCLKQILGDDEVTISAADSYISVNDSLQNDLTRALVVQYNYNVELLKLYQEFIACFSAGRIDHSVNVFAEFLCVQKKINSYIGRNTERVIGKKYFAFFWRII